MPSTLEATGKHTVKLTVEVPADQVEKDLDRVYRRIASQVKVPGFRKGKVPRKIIDTQIGRDAVMEQFVQDTVPDYWRDAVREHELAPISEPEIDIERLEEGSPLVFTAQVEVRPRLELDDYKGVKVEAPSVEVTDAEVEGYIDRLRDRFAELEVTSHPARRGDYVVADIRATVHGQEIPEASRPDYLYEIGSGEFVPKLDEELEGKRKGEILKFNASLPDGEREASFQVLVKEVKSKKLPPADEGFAKTASEFDTIEQLREDVRAKLRQAKERQAQGELRERVLQTLIERVDVDLPDRLVDHETEHRVADARERAERMGTTLEELLQSQGWDELRFRADARGHAMRAIKADLVLEAVARKEGLSVSPEEIGAEVAKLAQALGRDPRELAKTLDRGGAIGSLAGDILRSKALDVLVEHADVVSIEPEEEPPGAGTTPDQETPEASEQAPEQEQE